MITGRVWKFGDNINTDLMLPGHLVYRSQTEQSRAVFNANRPGWIDNVNRGDIIIGGRNYGTGSARPAARSLVNIGIACLVAESINGLFFRNCVNYGLLALQCPGVSDAFSEGDIADVWVEGFTVHNQATDVTLQAKVVHPNLLSMMRAGGLLPVLEAQGLITRDKLCD